MCVFVWICIECFFRVLNIYGADSKLLFKTLNLIHCFFWFYPHSSDSTMNDRWKCVLNQSIVCPMEKHYRHYRLVQHNTWHKSKDKHASITENLLTKALNYASTLINISQEDRNIIIHAKRSLLFHQDSPWIKKNTNNARVWHNDGIVWRSGILPIYVITYIFINKRQSRPMTEMMD